LPRPLKCRFVGREPRFRFFKPRGVSLDELEEVVLTVDELESIRLADLEGFYQERAAGEMDVSRQTFGNIINSAHRKVAEAIVLGKAVRIEGGFYAMEEERTFRCPSCRHEWTARPHGCHPGPCPRCLNPEVRRASKGKSRERPPANPKNEINRRGES
jgi:predicted DNA-binding protein (UPF0251 family)